LGDGTGGVETIGGLRRDGPKGREGL
jgi:hypothetical protein